MGFSQQFNNRKVKKYRDYEATAIIGDKRQGKTTLTKLLIDEYMTMYPNRKVLVYDISNAFGKDGYGFKGYPLITLDELYNGKKRKGKTVYWSKGVRRITAIDTDDILAYMADSFTDGLLVIDEATTVMKDKATAKHRAVMITHTNHRVDIIMIFHALAFVPRRLRANFWNYFFFKTPDVVSSKEIEAMGFPNPKAFHRTWLASQQAPHQEDRIMQYFTCFSRDFQVKS